MLKDMTKHRNLTPWEWEQAGKISFCYWTQTVCGHVHFQLSEDFWGEKNQKTEINWIHLGETGVAHSLNIHCLKECNSQNKAVQKHNRWCLGIFKSPGSNLPVPLCLFVLSAVLEPIICFTVGCVPYMELPLKWATMPTKFSRMRFLFQITQLSNFMRSMNAINQIKVFLSRQLETSNTSNELSF